MKRRFSFGRLTPSQESVYRFVGNSTRWLTLYQISKLTGVSEEDTRSAIHNLRRVGFVEKRKHIGGWDNGEWEFKCNSKLEYRCKRSALRNHPDIVGVEPLAKRLRRILGKDKAKQYAEFIK